MPRDHARINLAIWNDDDFRSLPPQAQHLYWVLWTHPELSYAGVVDWRPGRIAARAGGWTRAEVETAADCLRARLFLITDDDTEEALLRSWVRWDGLMRQGHMGAAMAAAASSVASRTLHGVIVHEATKLRALEPTFPSWAKPQIADLLDQPAIDPRSLPLPADPFTPPLTPTVTPRLTPQVTPPVTMNEGVRVDPPRHTPPTPSPSTTPSTSLPAASGDAPADAGARPTPTGSKTRGTRIPQPFIVSPDMVTWARENTPGLDHRAVTAKFVDYWAAVAGAKGIKLDWTATWRNWMRREYESVGTGRPAPRAATRGDRQIRQPGVPDNSKPWTFNPDEQTS